MRLRLALVSSVALALLSPVVTSAADPAPIPPLPTDLLSQPFLGTPAVARPVTAPPVPQNPHLAANGGNSMHNDAYASDSYRGLGPLGKGMAVRSASYGVSECATIAFDQRHRLLGLCGGLQGSELKLIDPANLSELTSLAMPQRHFDPASGTTPLNDLCGGAYFYLDNLDHAFVVTTDNTIWRVDVGAASLAHKATYPIALPQGDCPIALLPDWNGLLWFVSRQGRVGTIDLNSGVVHQRQFTGETIANSFASDETGATYVVSDHALYRLVADANDRPQVLWRRAYDRGTTTKPGQLSQGSGTTPTLIGKSLVAITDNAEPRMNVIYYNRLTGQRLCGVPVFQAGSSDTENSLASAGGADVVVENNYGYQGPQSTILGRTTSPGLAKVAWNGGDCKVAWTSPLSAPTSVPKVSLGAGLLYAYTKAASTPNDDSWFFTAIDLRTGRTVWRQRTGNGIQWNNHYAAIYLGPDGAAYMPTLAGLIRLKDGG